MLRTLLAFVALLRALYGAATASAALEPFTRDPALDQSLSALRRRPVDAAFSLFDEQLERASAGCRALRIHALALSKRTADESDDAAYCRKVRYVRQLHDKQRRAHRELQDLRDQQQQAQVRETEDTDEIVQRTGDVAERDARDVELQEFLEQYAETSQPAVLTPSSAATLDSSERLGFASEAELTAKCAPLRLQDATCRELLGRFRVPVFVAHNYVLRTNVSLAETFLPALVRVVVSAKETMSCPLGLHMLAVTLSEGATVADIFDQRFAPLLPHSNGVEEVQVSATPGAFFDRSSTANDVTSKLSPEHRIDALLPAHSVLFVPGSKFVTLRAASDRRLLRFCFVDASNFNAVKQELGAEALVNDEEHALLLSLLAPAFDRSMPRRVQSSNLLWPNYITWPKETKFLKKSDLMNSEGGTEQLQFSRRKWLKQWQDDKRWEWRVETLTLPVSLPPVVVNITRSTATLRWQDLYELPKRDITPYGYIVRWKSVGDDASSGSPSGELDAAAANAMNITRKQIVRSALPTTLFGDDFDGHDIEGAASGLATDTKYTFSVQIFVDDTLGFESFSSRVAQTSPCGEPSGARGVPKASDIDTACATLQWLDPTDDGGKPVGLYLISMRQVQDSVDALVGAYDASQSADGDRVVTLGGRLATRAAKRDGWKSARLCKLAPGATYLFRIAAMNAIGVGAWSVQSDPVQMSSHGTVASSRHSLSAANVPTVRGRGDPECVPMHTFSVRELKDLITSHGPDVVVSTLSASIPIRENEHSASARRVQLVLSDVNENVVLHTFGESKNGGDTETGSEVSFDVWSAHYSPRAFHVSSEIVRADPLDASTPLRNADQAKDRAMLVSRGAVPLVFKAHYAQLAGALGVVIADVNDTCHGRFDQRCVPGGDKSRGEGFAAQGRHALWEQNRIPCVLALHAASQQLLELVAP